MLEASLYALGGPDQGITFDLEQDSVIIGRSSSCDIILMDTAASRRHFKLERHGATFLLKNLSSHGTRVNDHRIDEVLVEDGDRISVGQTQLELQLREAEVLPGADAGVEARTEPRADVLRAPPAWEGGDQAPETTIQAESLGARTLIQPLRRKMQLQSRGWAMASNFKEGSSPQADFYEFISVPENKLGLMLVDLSGAGMNMDLGALVTRSVLKAVLQTVASPAEALRVANRILREDLPQGMYVEACIVVFDSLGKKLTMARAGSPRGFHWQKKLEKSVSLEPQGIAINIGSPDLFDESIHEQEVAINGEDLLFFCSDGVALATDHEGRDFGGQELEKIMGQGASSPQEMVQRVGDGLNVFIEGVPPEDDVVLVAVGLSPS